MPLRPFPLYGRVYHLLFPTGASLATQLLTLLDPAPQQSQGI